MTRTVLNRRATFFIDVFNIIAHIDLFLYNELWFRIVEGDDLLNDLFSKSLPSNWKETGYYSGHTKDISIIKLASAKHNQNILLDLIDKDVFKEICPNMLIGDFLASLYYDFLMNPTCPEYIQLTEFGNTIKILLTDTNLDKLCLYMPFKSDFVCSSIMESFIGLWSSKVSMIFGNKNSHLSNKLYDTYVLENVNDIDTILFDNIVSSTEVIIPTYEYNMVTDRTNLEKLVEQVTFQRLKLQKTPIEYTKKGLDINTMNVPL